jgi:two-component system, cell cycle sensor histidine kinase and response regulator CckA
MLPGKSLVPPSEALPSRRPLRVLVIQDNADSCRGVTRALGELSSFDSSVTTATGSASGLSALLQAQHEVCFLDDDLREDGSLDVVRKARAAGVETLIMLLASASDFRREMDALQSGVTLYLEKYLVSPNILDRILRNMLTRDRLSHQHRADQRALEASEKRLRSIVEWAGILVYEWDLETDALQWDGNTGGSPGYEAAELPKTLYEWIDLIHPDDRHRVESAIDQHLENVTGEFHEEYRIRDRDGAYRVWMDRGMVARGKDGDVVRWIGMISDVTEARQLADRMRVTQRLEALGRLAGGIAHDFNNIITVIAGYVGTLLAELPPGSPMSADLRQVHNAAERAASLTKQLLAFSRKQLLEPVVLDVNDVVRAVDAMLRRTIGDDIELSFEPSNDLWAVRADRGQLEQVLVNLAVNARDAMPDGGKLVVRTTNVETDGVVTKRDVRMAAGRYVLLQVHDSGTGIQPEVVKHIFDPFFTTKERGHGTGLGLATVYGIVKQSGGYVWVDTAVGKGTVFSIYLPAFDGPARPLPGTRETEVSWMRPGDPKKTILVVEDEAAIRQMVTDVLERAGFQVIAAGSGAEGISAAAGYAGPIDLLVTDVILPGVNGVETAREIVSARPEIAVLYTSGYTEDVLGSSLSEGTRLLRKPFSASTLVQTVGKILFQSPPGANEAAPPA